jgi:hypothetical protein
MIYILTHYTITLSNLNFSFLLLTTQRCDVIDSIDTCAAFCLLAVACYQRQYKKTKSRKGVAQIPTSPSSPTLPLTILMIVSSNPSSPTSPGPTSPVPIASYLPVNTDNTPSEPPPTLSPIAPRIHFPALANAKVGKEWY